MQSVVFVIAAAAVIGWASGQDECAPPSRGDGKRPTHPSSCCKLQNIVPLGFMSVAEKCKSENPRPPKPSGPPPAGEVPKDIKNHHACMVECMFSNNNLLNSDKTLNEDAIKKAFISNDTQLQPVIDAAILKCLSSYKNNIDQTLNCTSGAAVFEKCLMRQLFLNCPSSLWTSSADCEALKAKVTKCPNLPVWFHGGRHRQSKND